ncbi:MAG: hypothetical protein JWN36_1214 [Microbacteriaceae bacterium]|jgi:hypothetical protein|nr:hypothetical protein [Microbacteriaceae bacterium]
MQLTRKTLFTGALILLATVLAVAAMAFLLR